MSWKNVQSFILKWGNISNTNYMKLETWPRLKQLKEDQVLEEQDFIFLNH